LLLVYYLSPISNSYEIFLIARTAEAIVIPAILTASMSILASDKKNLKFNMSIYVASTVFGGLIGRVMSGFIATEFGWRIVFVSLSLGLLLGIYFINKLNFTGEANIVKPKIKDIISILHDKRFVVIYSLMFIVFFVFAGLLNILPFKMKAEFPDVSETQIGLLYLGYGVGIVVSLNIHRFIDVFKKELRVIIFGIIIFIIATLWFIIPNPYIIFAMVFVFCFGMFTIHTVATRLANSLKQSQKAITSGMYLSFYYIGGAVGSIIPPIFYARYGWNNTIYLFVSLLFFALYFVYLNKKLFREN